MSNQTEKKQGKKFNHSKSKIIFLETFLMGNDIYYLVQTEAKELIIGEAKSDYTLKRKGNLKERVVCISYSEPEKELSIGCSNGSIGIIDLSNFDKEEIEVSKIDPVDGDFYLALFNIESSSGEGCYLIAISSQGIIRRFKDKKLEFEIRLPFNIVRALSNKEVEGLNSIALVFLKENGKFPYVFTAASLLELTNENRSKDEIEQWINEYEECQVHEEDELSNKYFIIVLSEAVTSMALSNSERVLAIATGKIVAIYALSKDEKYKKWMIGVQDYKFEETETVTSIDIVNTKLVLISLSKIVTFDVETREKISNSLTIGRSDIYELVFWSQNTKGVFYASLKGDKTKLKHYELTLRQLKNS